MLVLDRSGRIDYLDLDTLDYNGTAATLVTNNDHLNLFGNKIDDLAAYLVMQLVDEDQLPAGVIVTVLPRHLLICSLKGLALEALQRRNILYYPKRKSSGEF